MKILIPGQFNFKVKQTWDGKAAILFFLIVSILKFPGLSSKNVILKNFLFLLIISCLRCYAQDPALIVQSGHFGEITCIAFNEAGNQMISCGKDKTIRIWDLKSRLLSGTISQISEKDINNVCYGMNDSILISQDNDFLIYRNIATGKQIRKISLKAPDEYLQEDHHILEPVKSHDLLITNFHNSGIGIELRALSSGEIIRRSPSHEGYLTGAAFYPFQNLIIYTYDNGEVYSFDYEKNIESQLCTFPEKSQGIAGIRILEHDLYIFTGAGLLTVFDLRTKSIKQENKLINSAGYFYRRNHPIALLSSGGFVFYDQDAQLNYYMKIFYGEASQIVPVGNMPDFIATDQGNEFLAVAIDGSIFLYNPDNLQLLHEFKNNTNWYDQLVLTDDPGIFYTIPIHSYILNNWNLEEGKAGLIELPEVDEIFDIERNNSRNEWAVSSGLEIFFLDEGFNRIIDSLEITPIDRILWDSYILPPGRYKIRYSADGTKLLTQDGKTCGIKLWDRQTKKIITSVTIDDDDQIIEHLDYCSRLNLVLAETSNNYFGNYKARLVDLNSNKIIWETTGNLGSFFYPKQNKALVPDGILDLNTFDVRKPSWANDLNNYSAYPAISGDEKWLCYNFRDTLKIVNLLNDSIFSVGIHEGMEDLKISSFRSRVLTCGRDGSIRLWDYQVKKLIAVLITGEMNNPDKYIDKDLPFIILTHDDFYMGSKTAGDMIAYRFEGRTYSFDQFDAYFNRPDIVIDRLQYADSSLAEAYKLAYEKRFRNQELPDIDKLEEAEKISLNIINRNEIPLKTGNNQIIISFTAEDPSCNIKTFQAWVNGVRMQVPGSDLNLPARKMSSSVTITLSPGINVIELSVTNEHSVESLHEIVETEYYGSSENKNLYIIGIGLSEYRDESFNLKYPVKDVRDFIRYQTRSSRFSQIFSLELLNRDFTIPALGKVRDFLSGAKVTDQVILFYAGHGLLDKQHNYYLAAWDMDFPHPEKYGISLDSVEYLLSDVPSRERVVLIDACNSGLVDKSAQITMAKANISDTTLKVTFRGANVVTSIPEQRDAFELMQALFYNLNRGAGTNIISAAGGTQFAYESGSVNNGLFTWAYLNGIRTGNADINDDGSITISEIKSYVEKNVLERSNGLQKPVSRQLNYYNDFVIWNTSDADHGQLQRASSSGDIKTLELLLSEGVDVNTADPESYFTALHYAARAGNNEALNFLLEHGAKINLRTFLGWTPLWLAACNNHYQSCIILLNLGADKNIPDNNMQVPMDAAMEKGFDNIVDLFKNSVAIIGKLRLHRPVFQAIADNDSSELLYLLGNNSMDINYIDPEYQFSLIHFAVIRGNYDHVKILIERGANPDFQVTGGITPLMVAAYLDNYQMVKLLLEGGADKNLKNDHGETALDLAKRHEGSHVPELLQ